MRRCRYQRYTHPRPPPARGLIHQPWEDAEHERNAGRPGGVMFDAKSIGGPIMTGPPKSPNFSGQRKTYILVFTIVDLDCMCSICARNSV